MTKGDESKRRLLESNISSKQDSKNFQRFVYCANTQALKYAERIVNFFLGSGSTGQRFPNFVDNGQHFDGMSY